MDVERPSLSELSDAFHSKMNAAHFFYGKIAKIYQPESNISKIPDDLFYYFDAAIFELHAASQMLLQIINIKSGINEQSNHVNWSRHFQDDLKKNRRNLFDWWETFNNSPQYHLLESMREYISHRGGSFLQVSTGINDQINLLSTPIRFRYYKNQPQQKPTGKSIEILDELNAIAAHLNEGYKDLKKF